MIIVVETDDKFPLFTDVVVETDDDDKINIQSELHN